MLYAPDHIRKETVACSPQAAREGVKLGMPLAEVRALLGSHSLTHFEAYDPETDRKALRRVALACQCFSPLTAVEEPDSLFLDITGCGPLFGGERNLAESVVRRMHANNLVVRAAVADTPGAAWAFAHHHRAARILVVPPGGHQSLLKTLPVEALRLSPVSAQLLHEFDIRWVEQLMQLPRAVLPARFGPGVLQRLDQALGDREEPITPETPSEPVGASWSFEDHCRDHQLLETVLEHLLGQVLASLHPQQLGIERLLCTMHALGAEPQSLTIGLLQASASLRYMMQLIRLQLERTRLPSEIATLDVQAVRVAPLEFRQQPMFERDRQSERWPQFAQLVELLSNRLGKDAVLRPDCCADAQPERAYALAPWLDQEITARPKADEEKHARETWLRPVQLHARPITIAVEAAAPGGPPLRFDWQQQRYAVACCWGPERIETGWWRGRDVRRDYYVVETAAGERFWLFRTDNDSWFLHGTFA